MKALIFALVVSLAFPVMTLAEDGKAEAYFDRGMAYFKKGDNDRAIANFNKSIELDPYKDAYFYRGMAYAYKGNVDRTISDLTKSIELNPELDEAYYNRGVAYGRKGDYDRFIADYKIAARLGHVKSQKYLRDKDIGW